MKKIKTYMTQGVVFSISFLSTVLVGMIMIIVCGTYQPQNKTVEEVKIETFEDYNVKKSGPRYVLNQPEDSISETVITEVTEETIAQKSARLEDIMEVLSKETEGSNQTPWASSKLFLGDDK